MRYFQLLLPVVVGLAGCAADNATTAQRTSVAYVTSDRSDAYMTPEQSSALIMLPGDETTVVQMRYLASHEALASE